ncbi:MAG: hypothetical protein OXH15_18000 [Gammaproteobacteria bacterium]|nr:hypothetical protein [Gammaproteobacteria bacterium]
MQFTTRNSDAIRAGEVTLTFRNWRRPHARVGNVYRLRPHGAIRVTAVSQVRISAIADDDARRAGFDNVGALAAFLKVGHDAQVTRVGFELADEQDIRRSPDLGLEDVLGRLSATDRRSASPWTGRVLTLIATHPGRRAGDLAPTMGWELPKFKANVRKLKALGLTRSLEVGYRLTDLGERAVAAQRSDT